MRGIYDWLMSAGIALVLGTWIGGTGLHGSDYRWPHYVGFVTGAVLFMSGIIIHSRHYNQQQRPPITPDKLEELDKLEVLK